MDDAKAICEPEVVKQVAKWHVSDSRSYTLVTVIKCFELFIFINLRFIFLFCYW